MIRFYVTEKQMRLIKGLIAGKTFEDIAYTKKEAETMKAMAKYLIQKKYLVKTEKGYTADLSRLIIGTNYQVITLKVEGADPKEHLTDIEVYKPTDEVRTKVTDLFMQGYKRTEIAKMLNMKKSEVLWTMMNMPVKTVNENLTAIPVQFEQNEVFKMLKKQDIALITVAKRLNISMNEVANIIHELEQMGAITIVRKHNYIAYLQNDVLLNPVKRRYPDESQKATRRRTVSDQID